MSTLSLPRAQASAVAAAKSAGRLMRANLRRGKKVNLATQHDIKLELDVQCQRRIESLLQARHPGVAILGEEGVSGKPDAPYRWVVDPIDGTVNFAHGIPHSCVSIALERRVDEPPTRARRDARRPVYETLAGVVYDPFCDELWTAIRGGKAYLNGSPIRVSGHDRLKDSIISIGFAKQLSSLERMLPTFNELVYRVRRVRIMGAAALAMVYVATGRLDAYLEYGLRWWDVAAGGLILECAGGRFDRAPVPGIQTHRVLATNGVVRKRLLPYFTR
jgi:myo-inositol-1(or 4)-monophosphatase